MIPPDLVDGVKLLGVQVPFSNVRSNLSDHFIKRFFFVADAAARVFALG
jgi:hypothetical protein